MTVAGLWDESGAEFTTPEQVDLRLEVGNIGSRGLAVMVDAAIRYGVMLLLYVVLVAVNQVDRISAYLAFGPKMFVVLFLLVVFVSEWFYFTVFEGVWNGQTPGKRLMRLRVVKDDGSPVGWMEILLRNFLRPIDTSGPFALVGMAFIFFHPKGQRPGDLMARTVVVREPKIDWDSLMTADESAARRNPLLMEPREWEMVSRFLRHSPALSPARRTALAQELRRVLQAQVRGTDLETSALEPYEWLCELSRRQ
jgi:uncharacterized RDD family membrane protein YckC